MKITPIEIIIQKEAEETLREFIQSLEITIEETRKLSFVLSELNKEIRERQSMPYILKAIRWIKGQR